MNQNDLKKLAQECAFKIENSEKIEKFAHFQN